MSSQKLAGEPPAERPLLPKQPEVNIGTAGHVDHGKCERWDQYAVINGQPMTGAQIDALVSQQGRLLTRLDGGEFYAFDENSVVSLDDGFQPTIGRAGFYKEHYAGTMVTIRTSTGRKISVTPSHPLLVNRAGTVLWLPSKKLAEGDHIAILRTVPLPEDASFREPLDEMRRRFDFVTWEEYQHLKLATDDFKNLNALEGSQIGQIRILADMSIEELGKQAGIDWATCKRILRGGNGSSSARRRILAALERADLLSFSPGEFAVRPKRGGGTRILRPVEMDDRFAKWLAFVWSEGSSSNGYIDVTQTIQQDMLREWLEITTRKLGLEYRTYKGGRYRIQNTAFVSYLKFKFGFNPGNETVCHVQPWVCRLPKSQKKAFLRWFLTLDGEFDEHSGQIAILQSNEKNIVMLSYLLHAFGIVPRLGTKIQRVKNGKKEYFRLSVSGRRDLRTFAGEIGFEDPRIQEKLAQYLQRIKEQSKETDFSIPIDALSMRRHLRLSGCIREGLGGDVLPRMKYSPWYKAYEMALRSGRISRAKLLLILQEVDSQIRRLDESVSKLGSSPGGILQHMSLAGLPQEGTANEVGYSRRKLMRIIRNGSESELESLVSHVTAKTKQNMKAVEAWLIQIRRLATTPLEFDSIKTIEREWYDGMVFDLSVPGPRNFIGGSTSIVCHNSTLTQSLSGVWTSAHSEELKRGITIKVGYADAAFYKCPSTPAPACYSTSPKCPVCGKDTQLLRGVSFVDCPGHESLMTNMLAGAFLMDGTILVIAANEPVPKPQTREHLQALQMLGMKKIVIAQNKVDLVTDQEAKKNEEAIESFVANTVAADAPVVPISAQQKLNIDALIEAIEDVIPTPRRDPKADPLLYVVRSFDVNRPGMDVKSLSGGVLGGSLVKGEFHVGDEIEVRPGMQDERTGKYVPILTKISTLQTGAGATEKVGPGGLVALGTHLDPTFIKSDQMVGSVIGKPGTLPETLEHITLSLELFEVAVGSAQLVKVDKVRPGENLRLNLGTASSPAVVTSARGDVVEVDLKKPVALEGGMRVAVSRRIAERWRLIGSGLLK